MVDGIGIGGNIGNIGNISPEDAEQILRALGVATVSVQEARLNEAINSLMAQIQGSPGAIGTALTPQIEQIRTGLGQVFDAISSRLGRFGGGQIERERGRALGAAGGRLQDLFAARPLLATSQLMQTLGGFQPFFAAQPPLQVVEQIAAPDIGLLGRGVFDIGQTIAALLGPVTGGGQTQSGIDPTSGQLILGASGLLGGGV